MSFFMWVGNVCPVCLCEWVMCVLFFKFLCGWVMCVLFVYVSGQCVSFFYVGGYCVFCLSM